MPSIRRTIDANNRRVRWLSASIDEDTLRMVRILQGKSELDRILEKEEG